MTKHTLGPFLTSHACHGLVDGRREARDGEAPTHAANLQLAYLGWQLATLGYIAESLKRNIGQPSQIEDKEVAAGQPTPRRIYPDWQTDMKKILAHLGVAEHSLQVVEALATLVDLLAMLLFGISTQENTAIPGYVDRTWHWKSIT
jgi:hypothetical protein